MAKKPLIPQLLGFSFQKIRIPKNRILISKFYRNRSSFKFQLQTRIRALRSASDFFRENYLKLIKFSKKIKKDVPKRVGPRNSHFMHKIDKNKPKIALESRHMTSYDSFLIFFERPHQELQFEYHIGYAMKLLKFDPLDPSKFW